jgi:hypothetical protein
MVSENDDHWICSIACIAMNTDAGDEPWTHELNTSEKFKIQEVANDGE